MREKKHLVKKSELILIILYVLLSVKEFFIKLHVCQKLNGH